MGKKLQWNMHSVFVNQISSWMGPWDTVEHTTAWQDILNTISEIDDLNKIFQGRTLLGHVAQSHIPDKQSLILIQALINSGADPLDGTIQTQIHDKAVNRFLSAKKYKSTLALLSHQGQADQVVYYLLRRPSSVKESRDLFEIECLMWKNASDAYRKRYAIDCFSNVFAHELITRQQMPDAERESLKVYLNQKNKLVENFSLLFSKWEDAIHLVKKPKRISKQLEQMVERWMEGIYSPTRHGLFTRFDLYGEELQLFFKKTVEHVMEKERSNLDQATAPVGASLKRPRL